jgi:hypothetical protein
VLTKLVGGGRGPLVSTLLHIRLATFTADRAGASGGASGRCVISVLPQWPQASRDQRRGLMLKWNYGRGLQS